MPNAFDNTNYARIANLNDQTAKGWRRVYRHIGWKTRNWSGGIWASPESSFEIGVTSRIGEAAEAQRFVNAFVQSAAFRAKRQHFVGRVDFRLTSRFFDQLEESLGDIPIWKSLYRLGVAMLSDSGRSSFDFFASRFLPWFFANYKNSRVLLLEASSEFTPRMHSIRKFFQIETDTAALTTINPPMTLARLHGLDTAYWPGDEVKIWCSMFWPFITAIPIWLGTCEMVLLLGSPWDTTEPFPPTLEKWWRNELLFAEERDVDDMIRRQRAGRPPEYLFDDITGTFDVDTMGRWFEQYLARVARLRNIISDFRLFADVGSRTPSYTSNLQLFLTVQRIVASTHYLNSSQPPFLAKGLLFDIADEFATMVESEEGKQASFFEWLFDSNDGGRWTQDTLTRIPEVGDYLSAKARFLYERMDSSIDAGLANPVPATRAHLIRLLRNARHGYWFRGDDLARNIRDYDANLSDLVPALAGLWWLAFLEEPWQLIRRDNADQILMRSYK